MRLLGQIHVTVAGEVIVREPSFLEKVKRGLGGSVDLDTGRVKVALEATALVDAVRRALTRLGVDNAVALIIDEQVIFHDSDGKAGDLPDLVLALSEHAQVFGRGFRELKLAVEHEEAGLHLLIETRAATAHAKGAPSAYVSVGGRIKDLEPRAGEDADAYRARVEPLAADRGRIEASRLAFESFVGRLEAALRAALPEAEVEQTRAQAVVVRPESRPARKPRDPAAMTPGAPGYDPYLAYYPSPMGMMLDVMMLSSFMHMMTPPPVYVMHPSGAPIGTVDDVVANPDLVSADASDPGDASGGGLDYDGDGIADATPDSFGDDGGFDGGGFDGGGFDGGGFD